MGRAPPPPLVDVDDGWEEVSDTPEDEFELFGDYERRWNLALEWREEEEMSSMKSNVNLDAPRLPGEDAVVDVDVDGV